MIDMKTRNAFAEGAKEEVSGQLELCGTFPGGSFFERKEIKEEAKRGQVFELHYFGFTRGFISCPCH